MGGEGAYRAYPVEKMVRAVWRGCLCQASFIGSRVAMDHVCVELPAHEEESDEHACSETGGEEEPVVAFFGGSEPEVGSLCLDQLIARLFDSKEVQI